MEVSTRVPHRSGRTPACANDFAAARDESLHANAARHRRPDPLDRSECHTGMRRHAPPQPRRLHSPACVADNSSAAIGGGAPVDTVILRQVDLANECVLKRRGLERLRVRACCQCLPGSVGRQVPVRPADAGFAPRRLRRLRPLCRAARQHGCARWVARMYVCLFVCLLAVMLASGALSGYPVPCGGTHAVLHGTAEY